LLRCRRLFDSFSDSLRSAQVNETLARLCIATKQHALAQDVIERETLLVEALTTSGILASRLRRFGEAKRRFEAAHEIAGRCGNQQGAGLSLLTMLEKIGDHLELTERIQTSMEVQRLLATTQQSALRSPLQRAQISLLSALCSSRPER
jgi:hypothetical protein